MSRNRLRNRLRTKIGFRLARCQSSLKIRRQKPATRFSNRDRLRASTVQGTRPATRSQAVAWRRTPSPKLDGMGRSRSRRARLCTLPRSVSASIPRNDARNPFQFGFGSTTAHANIPSQEGRNTSERWPFSPLPRISICGTGCPATKIGHPPASKPASQPGGLRDASPRLVLPTQRRNISHKRRGRQRPAGRRWAKAKRFAPRTVQPCR